MKTPLSALALFLLAAPAVHADENEDLRSTVAEMKRTIDELRVRVAELEKTQPSQPSSNPALSLKTSVLEAAGGKQVKTPVPDPRYPGYVPLPYTPFLVRFNFKPRLDLTVDSQNSGDPYRFVTAKLPLRGSPEHGGGEQFNLNANGTQIDFEVIAPDDPNHFRLYYQNDFFASDTRDMQYRLRHAYGEYGNFVAGFTYGVFEDPQGWPDTLDYEGTNSVIFARRPVIHYRLALNDQWRLTLGIEKPDFFVDDYFDSSISRQTRAPDGGLNLHWKQSDVGHFQLSTLFRSIGAKGDEVGSQRVFGWGVGLSGSVNVTKRDLLQAWFVYGEGIGGLGNDSGFENTDAAFDAQGDLQALRYFSALGGYTHHWNEEWRSTLSYGYVNVENTSGQAGDAYHITHYGSANLIYRLSPQFSIGLEGLYGRREVRDGRTGEDFRLQLSLLYSMF